MYFFKQLLRSIMHFEFICDASFNHNNDYPNFCVSFVLSIIYVSSKCPFHTKVTFPYVCWARFIIKALKQSIFVNITLWY